MAYRKSARQLPTRKVYQDPGSEEEEEEEEDYMSES
jgi:hypothetical protein